MTGSYKYLYITILAFSLIASSVYISMKMMNEDTTTENSFSFRIEGKDYILPSPFPSFNLLHASHFKWNGLVESNYEISYPIEFQIALNLGSRAADGIVLLYAHEKEKARIARSSVLSLSEKLGISENISSSVADLDNTVVYNKPESNIIEKLSKLQHMVKKSLHEKKRDDLALFVELGGWLEGLHIVTKGIHQNYNPSSAAILRQPHIADLFIEALKATQNNANSPQEKKLIGDLIFQISKVYKILNQSVRADFPESKVKELHEVSIEIKHLIETPIDK